MRERGAGRRAKRLAPVMLLAMVAAACTSTLGTAVPACVEPRDASGALLIEYQSVPSAMLVPCINELPPGWVYNDLVPQRGRTRFHLDSDRVGSEFLEVTFEAT